MNSKIETKEKSKSIYQEVKFDKFISISSIHYLYCKIATICKQIAVASNTHVRLIGKLEN